MHMNAKVRRPRGPRRPVSQPLWECRVYQGRMAAMSEVQPKPRRRWFQFGVGWVFAWPLAFCAGLVIGYCSFILGPHFTAWPTILLCGPPAMLGALLCEHDGCYAEAMVMGTGMTYAVYAFVIALFQNRWAI